jgi:metal-responsive CopG/Arc/MetJ family transcriptional regulator
MGSGVSLVWHIFIIGANMSKVKLWLRMTEHDQRRLDVIAESMGGMSRSAVVRFLIRQWTDELKKSATQVPNHTPRL